MKYSLIVPGRPVPAQRMTRRSKWTKRAKKSLEYQETVAWWARVAKLPRIEGLVVLTARFYIYGKNHGDLSNYVKAIEDGLQYAGVLPNDRQVVRYGEGTGIYFTDARSLERAEVEIEEVHEHED